MYKYKYFYIYISISLSTLPSPYLSQASIPVARSVTLLHSREPRKKEANICCCVCVGGVFVCTFVYV